MKKQLRREYYIYPDIQFKYIRLVILLMALVTILILYTVDQTSYGILARKLSIVCPEENMRGVYSLFNSTLVLRLLVMAAVIVVATMYLSHRIAGPVYRIERDLNEVSQGDLTRRIVLRKTDDLKRLANELNGVISRMDNLVATLKASISELQSCSKEAMFERGEDMKLCFEKWSNNLEKISKEISRFKTSEKS